MWLSFRTPGKPRSCFDPTGPNDHRTRFRECVGDDLNVKMGVPFPNRIRLKPGETVLFSWIMFTSRAHRDRVNAKVMRDERLSKMDPEAMPFDYKRMVYGGFEVLVDA